MYVCRCTYTYFHYICIDKYIVLQTDTYNQNGIPFKLTESESRRAVAAPHRAPSSREPSSPCRPDHRLVAAPTRESLSHRSGRRVFARTGSARRDSCAQVIILWRMALDSLVSRRIPPLIRMSGDLGRLISSAEQVGVTDWLGRNIMTGFFSLSSCSERWQCVTRTA